MCPSSQWVPVLWTMCSALLMLIVLCGSFKRPVMMWRARPSFLALLSPPPQHPS